MKTGDHVRHGQSNWAGNVIGINEARGLVTVVPTHPRPKKVLVEGRFVSTPVDWAGWAPITVTAEELELAEGHN